MDSALFKICSACLGAKLFHAVARASKRPRLQTVFLNCGQELCPAKVIAPHSAASDSVIIDWRDRSTGFPNQLTFGRDV